MSLESAPIDRRRVLGERGERATAAAYGRRGYRVLARNWRCRAGELDLVLIRGETLVFCEVKTRRGDAFGGGYEAVTWSKRRKLRALAELFLQSSGIRPRTMRFDVASVRAGRGEAPDVEVFEDAF
jgi:putative endonuclease